MNAWNIRHTTVSTIYLLTLTFPPRQTRIFSRLMPFRVLRRCENDEKSCQRKSDGNPGNLNLGEKRITHVLLKNDLCFHQVLLGSKGLYGVACRGLIRLK